MKPTQHLPHTTASPCLQGGLWVLDDNNDMERGGQLQWQQGDNNKGTTVKTTRGQWWWWQGDVDNDEGTRYKTCHAHITGVGWVWVPKPQPVPMASTCMGLKTCDIPHSQGPQAGPSQYWYLKQSHQIYLSYIYKVLKQAHPDTGILNRALKCTCPTFKRSSSRSTLILVSQTGQSKCTHSTFTSSSSRSILILVSPTKPSDILIVTLILTTTLGGPQLPLLPMGMVAYGSGKQNNGPQHQQRWKTWGGANVRGCMTAPSRNWNGWE